MISFRDPLSVRARTLNNITFVLHLFGWHASYVNCRETFRDISVQTHSQKSHYKTLKGLRCAARETPPLSTHIQTFVDSSSLGLHHRKVSLEPEANKEPSTWSNGLCQNQVLAPCRPSNKAMLSSSVTPSHVANRWHIGSHRTPQAVSSLGLRLYNPLHNFIEQDFKKKTHLSFARKGFLSFALTLTLCFGFTSMSDLDLSSSLRFPLQLMGVSWVHRTRIESNQNQNYLHVCTQIAKFQLPSQYFGSANSIYLAVCSTTFCWSPATLCVVSVRLT